jgi:hypothetical protein
MRQLGFESLEERRVLANFTVTAGVDDGTGDDGTLSQGINVLNSSGDSGTQQIFFLGSLNCTGSA